MRDDYMLAWVKYLTLFCFLCRYGFTSRQWGLTLDNIISHEVILANGTIVQASSNVNSDLFWVSERAGLAFSEFFLFFLAFCLCLC